MLPGPPHSARSEKSLAKSRLKLGRSPIDSEGPPYSESTQASVKQVPISGSDLSFVSASGSSYVSHNSSFLAQLERKSLEVHKSAGVALPTADFPQTASLLRAEGFENSSHTDMSSGSDSPKGQLPECVSITLGEGEGRTLLRANSELLPAPNELNTIHEDQ